VHLFVYYKVRAHDRDELRGRVSELFSRAWHDFGLVSRLMRRPEAENGLSTWMEVYEDVPPEFDNWLRSQCDELDLLSLTADQRHAERFVEVPIDRT
jgi:hypothetical protein